MNDESTIADSSGLLHELENYPWNSDPEFQSGLAAILGSVTEPNQAEQLILRARCFYFQRKSNRTVDFNSYKDYRDRLGLPPPSGLTNLDDEQVGSAAHSETTGQMDLQDDTPAVPSPQPMSSTNDPAPYPTSFQEIVELITSGKPVPGIKEIPPTILEGQGTSASKARRKKPWERAEPATTEETPITT